MLELIIEMHMCKDEALPIVGRKVLIITNDGQELIAARIEDNLWQNLIMTNLWAPTYGRFNTAAISAWGYLSDRQWREYNVKQN